MEKNIKEAISIIEDVRKSMPECTNKAFLKGALNELNQALRLYDVVGRSEQFYCLNRSIFGDGRKCEKQCLSCEKNIPKQ